MKNRPSAKIVQKEEVKNTETVVKKKGWFRLSRKDLCIPYGLFLGMFVIVPLLFIVAYAFTDANGNISLDNFARFFSNQTSLTTLLISIGLGVLTTLICLLIAYPLAYILARSNLNKGGVLLMLFIMPMWINFTLRAMAMIELLTLLGIFNKSPFVNVLIGMVYDFLPFMILPLYTTLHKMDRSYEEAAADLGANKAGVFFKVTLPLSMPGIISGITMVFLPTMTWYVISDSFGRHQIPIIGRLIQDQFGGLGGDWNYGSAIALIMLVIMFVVMLTTGEFKSDKTVSKGGMNL